MTRMKRTLALVLVCALLSGCGGAPAETTAPTVPPTTIPPETVPPTTVPTEPPLSRAEEILARMTPEEKLCQMFIVTRDAADTYPVGGIIYFAGDLHDRDQTLEMIGSAQSGSRLGLFICVDEEGGIVSRLGSNEAMGVTKFPNMGRVGKNGERTAAYEVGYTLGSELRALGFNLDFAPVADVDSNPRNPVIGKRAFHSDPAIAADLVAACVEGFGDSGMICTLKHFPGHGDTAADSHRGAVSIGKTREALEQCELLPFRSGIAAGAPVVMVGHISVPELTGSDVPATLSAGIVTGLLRQELGFDGLIVTDAMEMQAITDRYSSGEAAVLAVLAGVDLILMPDDLCAAVEGLRTALADGTLTQDRIDESVLRILQRKLDSGIIE